MDSSITNSFIKIEPNAGFERVNDGGFEALLDEFGPDNDDRNLNISNLSEDIEVLPNPEYNSNSMDLRQEQQTFINDSDCQMQPLPNLMNADITTNVRVQEHNSTSGEATNFDNKNNQSNNVNAEANSDIKKGKVDLRKRRRRTKRSIAKAAALVCASGDLSKLTLPIAVSNETTSTPQYITAVDGKYEVVVFANNYPETKLTDEQFQSVQEKFLEVIINDTSLNVENWCPRFQSCSLKDGAIHFFCHDITTRHWIFVTLPKLELWPDTKLVAVDAGNLLKLTRVVVWIQRTSLDNVQILKLLEKQNDRLKTNKWVIYDRAEPNEKGIRLLVGIDETSIQLLREVEGKLFLGLGQAEFILPNLPEPSATNLQDQSTINKLSSTNKTGGPQNKSATANVSSKPFGSGNVNQRINSSIRPAVTTPLMNLNIRPFPLQPQHLSAGLSLLNNLNVNARFQNSYSSWK